MLARIETKVWAAVLGSGGGATVGAAVLWLLGVLVWHGPSSADGAKAAVDAVPGPIAALVGLLLTAAGTLLGGYAAPPSNHAGNNATGEPMDDTAAGHDEPAPLGIEP